MSTLKMVGIVSDAEMGTVVSIGNKLHDSYLTQCARWQLTSTILIFALELNTSVLCFYCMELEEIPPVSLPFRTESYRGWWHRAMTLVSVLPVENIIIPVLCIVLIITRMLSKARRNIGSGLNRD